MSNSVRGIVTREINGERYEFRLAANEWCELEAEFGQTTGEILQQFSAEGEAGKFNMSRLRSLFRAALLRGQPSVTIQEAGDLISEIGIPAAGALIVDVVKASMPQQEDGGAGKPKAAGTKAPRR
ncbi:GTA-gp10 family protein [Allorhizobium undicola]|uniref:GTA-gp10 family protein n=1 Tax=Allorhizobium undicola TaxID=78527 RepID=UPI003D337E9C